MSEEDQHQESAFALRNTLKHHQTQFGYEKLYEQLGQSLYQEGWDETRLQWLLDAISHQCGALHAFITIQHAGALKIQAKRGNCYPVGARIPMMGALALWLKEPLQFVPHAQFLPNLWTFSPPATLPESLYCMHLPIAYQHRAVGLLGMLTTQPLSQNQLQVLYGLCGIIGFALYQQPQSPQRFDDALLSKLTPREREVFALLPSGASNAELAEKLGISPGTVKIHIERILAKLDVKDRTQAAVKAVEAGFTSHGLE